MSTLATWAAAAALIAGVGPASASGTQAAARVASARLELAITGFRNDRGQALVALFRGARGFPDDSRHAFRKQAFAIRARQVTAVFDRLPAGPIAVAVLHDENMDFEMNTGFLGIPTEGYGASRDAKGTFGPPSFEDARLTLRPGQRLKIRIRMRD